MHRLKICCSLHSIRSYRLECSRKVAIKDTDYVAEAISLPRPLESQYSYERSQEVETHGMHPERLRLLQAETRGSTDQCDNDVNDVGWQARTLSNGAILSYPEDEQPAKKSRISSSASSSRQVSSTFSTSASSTNSSVTSCSPVSKEYVDKFLDDCANDLYISVLQNLCPDNMRGSYCKDPQSCLSTNRHFACPDYAVLAKCRHDKPGRLTHSGTKHTVKGCTAKDKVDCKRNHPDGRPCRVEVVYFHIRASCITLRGGRYCQTTPCQWGHDEVEIRRAVMERKG